MLRNIFNYCLIIIAISSIALMADSRVDKSIDLLNNGRFQDAIQLLSQVVLDDPENAEAMTHLASAHLYLSEFDKASHYLDMLISKDNTNPNLFNMRGMARGSMHQLELAIMDFTEAIKLEPKFTQAYINRGSAYSQLKRWSNALRDFNIVLKTQTDNPDIYYQRGKCNYKLNNIPIAIKDFSAAIDKGYDFASIYYERANCYFKQGKLGKAITDYSSCLKIDPYSLNAINNRAVAYEQSGKKQQAEADRQIARQYSEPDRFMPDPETMPFVKYQSKDKKLSIKLPKGWHVSTETDNGMCRLLLTHDKPRSNGEYHVGIELTLTTDLYKKFSVRGLEQITKMFEENNRLSSMNYVEYNILEKTSFTSNGFNYTCDYYATKRDKFHQSAGMYVLSLPMEDDLLFGYMKAPQLMFGYYRMIFDRAMRTIEFDLD